MDILYSCLQGLIAGGYVGISLGPLAIWTAALLIKKEYLIVAAVLLGGTIGDALVAAFFLFGSSAVSELVADLQQLIRRPLVMGPLLIFAGWLSLELCSKESAFEIPESWRRPGAGMAFGVATWWNLANPDSFAAMPVLVLLGGVVSFDENVIRLIGFVPASLVTFAACIWTFAHVGNRVGTKKLQRFLQFMSIVGIIFGAILIGLGLARLMH